MTLRAKTSPGPRPPAVVREDEPRGLGQGSQLDRRHRSRTGGCGVGGEGVSTVCLGRVRLGRASRGPTRRSGSGARDWLLCLLGAEGASRVRARVHTETVLGRAWSPKPARGWKPSAGGSADGTCAVEGRSAFRLNGGGHACRAAHPVPCASAHVSLEERKPDPRCQSPVALPGSRRCLGRGDGKRPDVTTALTWPWLSRCHHAACQ